MTLSPRPVALVTLLLASLGAVERVEAQSMGPDFAKDYESNPRNLSLYVLEHPFTFQVGPANNCGSACTSLRFQSPEMGVDKTFTGADTAVAAPGDVYDPALFARLRAWRQGAARQAGQKAFYVFPDATLKRIAAARPQTLEDLGAIKGVGPRKLEQYGQDVLDTISRGEETE